MHNRDWAAMNEAEFEAALHDQLPQLPPEQIVRHVTPWKKAIYRALTGLALTAVTVNLWGLQYLLPIIGSVLGLLGFRMLRRENRWFCACYLLTILRAAILFPILILNATIYQQATYQIPLFSAVPYWNVGMTFAQFFCLWRAFRMISEQSEPSGCTGNAVALMVWYTVFCALALAGYEGTLVVPLMLLAYVLIIRSLFLLAGSLDDAGYAIVAAPIRVPDWCVTLLLALFLTVGGICAGIFGSSHPMDWQHTMPSDTTEFQTIRTQLSELGVPEDILMDLTETDLRSCAGAQRVEVQTNTHAVGDDGREILQITGVAIALTEKQDTWKLIHHFRWLENPGFYGTEAIQLWPTDIMNDGWTVSSGFTGQLLYDKNGQTFTADYAHLGRETHTTSSMFWGEQTSSSVFAAFSMPRAGANHRGYLCYEIREAQPGWIIDAWINYTHQRRALQYPVMTAMDTRRAFSARDAGAFRTVSDALQLFLTDLEGDYHFTVITGSSN